MATPKMTEQSELEHGALGTGGIVFMVLAFVAPIGAVAVAMVLGLLLGNGEGMPGAYLLSGIILLLFAVGYAAMSEHVTDAGAFYAYITKGLGRTAGTGAAFVALVAYNAIFLSVLGAFGAFSHLVMQEQLSIDLPWEAWSGMALVLIAIMGRRQVNLNAAVLGAALVLEVLIITVLDIGIVQKQGLSAFSLDSFAPSTVFSAGIGTALVFAFNSFIGFEATALFAEEAKNPKRTVPRATYIAVIVVAVFYAATSWCLVTGAGGADVQTTIAETPGGPGNFLFAMNAQYVGGFTNDLIQYLVVTSLFAALLATHNATARYFFALGREGLLPKVFAKTHPTLRSPYIASATQVGICAVIAGLYAITKQDPLAVLATSMGGLGVLGIVALQAGCAFAVIGFFARRSDGHWLKTLVAPLAGGIGLVVGEVLIITNYGTLVTGQTGIISKLPWLIVVAALAGFAYAYRLRESKPDVYAAMGGADVAEDVSRVAEPVGR